MQKEMQAYRRTNMVVATISMFSILLPALILPFRLAAPQLFPTCYSILILNRPCPMCGLTRGIGSIVWGRFGEAVNYNPLSPVFFSCFLLQIILRSYLIFSPLNENYMISIRKYDARIHLLLLGAYLIYALFFHIAG